MEWSDYTCMSVSELKDELKNIEEIIDYILNSGDRYDDVIELYDMGVDITTYSQLADDIELLIAEKEL